MNAPILILQMQRMGDLILTYPLLLWLARQYPGHPLWVVAERGFYEPLMAVSPQATYVDWSAAAQLEQQRYHLVLNLSHRPEAAALAGHVRSGELYGPYRSAKGTNYVRGDWQLYRTGLTHANRHNRFHWAELNALDVVDAETLAATHWSAPRGAANGKRVGLFLGASARHKRPSEDFWLQLVRELDRRGLTPVLLGGPAEVEMAASLARRLPGNVQNLAGQLSLDRLAVLSGQLALFITPDTGPMHLAAWAGTPVLNLSMGPVNPWETGPYQPGHWVLRPTVSCTGCWSCAHQSAPSLRKAPPCQQAFSPRRVALAASLLASGRTDVRDRLASLRLPGLSLTRSGRDAHGGYCLEHVAGHRPAAREGVDRLWQAFFRQSFRTGPAIGQDATARAFAELAATAPKLAAKLAAGLPGMAGALAKHWSHGLGADFWRAHPPVLRPLASHLHLLGQNHDFSARGKVRALQMLERLLASVAPGAGGAARPRPAGPGQSFPGGGTGRLTATRTQLRPLRHVHPALPGFFVPLGRVDIQIFTK